MIQYNALPWKEKQEILSKIKQGLVNRDDFIPPHIKSLYSVNLTFAGQISLLCYPPESFALLNLENTRKKYHALILHLTTWCSRHNTIPDAKWGEQLKEAFHILDSHELYHEPKLYTSDYHRLGKLIFKRLSPEETDARRLAFMQNPDMLKGIEKLAMLIGTKSAEEYFYKVIHNLQYEEVYGHNKDQGQTY